MTSLDNWISENIPDVVMDDAAAWLARLDSQLCNDADRLGFARWLAEDPCHRWAFEELSEIWAKLHTLTEVGEQASSDKVLPFPVDGGYRTGPQAPVAPPRRDWSTLAACLIVATAAFIHFVGATPTERWSTGTSETRQISLEDGSSMELNAQTEVIVRIDWKRRTIDLTNGEAVFDVARDERPFVVRTPHGTIAALGTRFAVDSRDDFVEVAVIDGTVSVSATQVAAPLTEFEDAASATNSAGSARLAAGEGAQIDEQAVRAERLQETEIEQRLSWREGSAWFDQETLEAVLEDMQRYTDLSIHVGHPDLLSRRISGQFSTTDIDDFFRQISENYNIFVDQGEQGWVVLRPATDRLEK